MSRVHLSKPVPQSKTRGFATPALLTALMTLLAISALNLRAADPEITTAPASQTVCAGTPVAFTVVATGTGTLTYQWSRDAVELTGATSDTLNLNSVQAADAGSYTVLVTGDLGSTPSTAATLAVTPGPVVSVNSETICPAASATLTATTDAVNPSYLWSPGGATTDSITVAPASTTVYTVTVTDGTSLCSASGAGTVTVLENVGASDLVGAPYACEGTSVTFTTVPSGAGPFTFSWTKDGFTIDGALSDSYSIAAVAAGDAGQYCVTVSGACGSPVTRCATLGLAAAPVITGQPQNQSRPMGNTATFSVSATSGATATYQWQLNEADISGATASSYTTPALTLADAGGSYRVLISNCAGLATSEPALLGVTPVAGVSYDFNSPGQYVNTPYNRDQSDWVNSALPSVPFEAAAGGVGGSGCLDMLAGGTENTSVLMPFGFDFSLPGQQLVASIMVKVKAPTSNNRLLQLGFQTLDNATAVNRGTQSSLTGINGNGFMTVRVNSTAQPALTYQLEQQHKVISGTGTSQGNATSTATLIAGNWYKLVATFVNKKDIAANTYSVSGTFVDMGADGLTPGATVFTLGPVDIVNADLVNASTLFLAFRGFENTGVDLYDNAYTYATEGNLFWVQQPASPTLLQGRTTTLSARVDGTGPYAYQWFKNGNPIAGAQNWKYTLPPARLADHASQYTVTVTGPNNSLTSDPAILTVTPDPLAVVSAGSADGFTVGVRFNQPVDPTTAADPANYSINGQPAFSATVRPDGESVSLVPAVVLNGAFTVVVSGVQDLSGGTVGLDHSASGNVANLASIDVNSPITPGETFSAADGQFELIGNGNDTWNTADMFHYVYAPRSGDFDVRMQVPRQDVVRAPSKAEFMVRESLDPASRMLFVEVNPLYPGRNYFSAGKRDGFGSNSSGWQSFNPAANYPDAWMRLRRVGDTFTCFSSTDGWNWTPFGRTIAVYPETVYLGIGACAVVNAAGAPHRVQVENYGDFAGYAAATVAMLDQPASLAVEAGASAAFQVSALAVGATNSEISFQWQQSDGMGGWINVPAANGFPNVGISAEGATNSFTTPTLTALDSGATFRCIAQVSGGGFAVSAEATLTVTDTAAPTVSSAAVLLGATHQVVLVFSEPLTEATATTAANYAVTNSAGADMGVLGASLLNGDPRTVVLTTATLLAPDGYGVLVNGVADLAGNAIAAHTLLNFSVTIPPPAQPVVVELYMGIGGGDLNALANMTNTARFQARTPDSVVYNTVFGFNAGQTSFPDTGINNYGARIYTYFVPTATGLYRFYIRSDDASQLFMNTNAVNSTDPAGAKLLVQRNGANANYGTGADQLRQNVPLVAGQKYYLEARFKEGSGGDGFALMVQPQGTTGTPGAASVIGGAVLEYPAAVAPATPVLVDYFGGFPTSTPNLGSFNTLTNDARWLANNPDTFAWYRYNSVFGYNVGLGDSTRNGYGMRLRSHFVAPSNGLYRFWIRVDDAAELWMNTNAVNSTDPAGISLLASQNAYNANYVSSAQNVPLTGGQAYYTEARWMEGGGGDGFMMTVRAQSDGATPPNTEVTLPELLQYPASLDTRLGAVTLAGLTPVDPTVADGQSLTLTAGRITGAGPYGYQWYKNGQLQSGPNAATYTPPPLGPADNGAVYTLVLTNGFSTASASTTVTVDADTTAPTIVGAAGNPYLDAVTVTFSEPVNAATATYPANYDIAGLTVLAANLDGSRTRVALQTTLQTPGTAYTVVVNGVRDLSAAGNLIAADTAVDFTAWLLGGRGLYVELFTSIGTAGAVADLTNNAKFIQRLPDVTGYLNRAAYDSRSGQAFSTSLDGYGPFAGNGLDGYGARAAGWFEAPSNGVYRFYIVSDDSSQLFMNTNEVNSLDPAGRTLMAKQDGANLGWSTNLVQRSPDVTLVAGQLYYTEVLLKEGTGGDYFNVLFRDAADTVIPADRLAEAIPGGYFVTAGNPDLPLVDITEAPPAAISLAENDLLTLRLLATVTPTSLAPATRYYWQKYDPATAGFTNIPGATGNSLSTYVGLADDGSQLRVVLDIPGTNLVFTTALSVAADTEAPYIVSVNSLDGYSIGVCFNERLDPFTGFDMFNYGVYVGGNAVPFDIVARPDGRSLTITLLDDPQVPLTGAYTVEAYDVQDLATSPNRGSSNREGTLQYLTAIDVNTTIPGATWTCVPNELDVSGDGADIWGAADGMRYVYREVTGNFDVKVRLQDLQYLTGTASGGWVKGGLMARASTNANSRNVAMLATPTAGQHTHSLQYRLIDGGTTVSIRNGTTPAPLVDALNPPYPNAWLRLQRVGPELLTYIGSNGTDWNLFYSVNTYSNANGYPFPDTLLVGLAVTSHDASQLATAQFRDLYFPLPPTITAQPAPALQTVPVGTAVSYTAAAVAPPDSGMLSWQWQKNGLDIPGATSDTLALPAASVLDAGSYQVKVGNDGGAVISDPVTLLVSNEAPEVVAKSLGTILPNVAVSTPVADLLAGDSDPEGEPLTIVAVSGVVPVTYETNFNDGLPVPGGTSYGSATVGANGGVDDSGCLQLTLAAGSQTGAFVLDDLTPGKAVSAFIASFKLRIGDGSANPADGLSFNFAGDLPDAAVTAAEDGIGTGLSLCIDNYDSGSLEAPAIEIRWQQTNVVGKVNIAKINGPQWFDVFLRLEADGSIDVVVNGFVVFADLATGFTPMPGRFGFYARTGGQYATHWVDDLSLTVATRETEAGGTVELAGTDVVYTPPADWCGDDAYYYIVSDGELGGLTASAVVVTVEETTPAPPPGLSLSTVEGGLAIAWPKTCRRYVIQETTSLSAPVTWSDAAVAVTDEGTHYQVIVPINGTGPRFFSLRRQ